MKCLIKSTSTFYVRTWKWCCRCCDWFRFSAKLSHRTQPSSLPMQKKHPLTSSQIEKHFSDTKTMLKWVLYMCADGDNSDHCPCLPRTFERKVWFHAGWPWLQRLFLVPSWGLDLMVRQNGCRRSGNQGAAAFFSFTAMGPSLADSCQPTSYFISNCRNNYRVIDTVFQMLCHIMS
jgi:hypothetical protein